MPSQYLFGKFIYVSDHGTVDHGAPMLLAKLRLLVSAKAGMDLKAPFRYGFLNRDVRKARWIANMEDIRGKVQVKYPEFNWENISHCSTILETARLYNSLRFVFTPQGAGMTNIIFMQPRNVVCEVQTSRLYPGFIKLARIFGLLDIVSRFGEYSHSRSWFVMPEDIGIEMVDVAVSYLRKTPASLEPKCKVQSKEY
jgi:hypothetical protein